MYLVVRHVRYSLTGGEASKFCRLSVYFVPARCHKEMKYKEKKNGEEMYLNSEHLRTLKGISTNMKFQSFEFLHVTYIRNIRHVYPSKLFNALLEEHLIWYPAKKVLGFNTREGTILNNKDKPYIERDNAYKGTLCLQRGNTPTKGHYAYKGAIRLQRDTMPTKGQYAYKGTLCLQRGNTPTKGHYAYKGAIRLQRDNMPTKKGRLGWPRIKEQDFQESKTRVKKEQ